MNAAVRAIVKVAAGRGVEVVGIERGYSGLIEDRTRSLTRRTSSTASGLAPTPEVELSASLGGSFLGSARCKEFYEAKGRELGALAAKRFDGLVVIGGNGSLTGAHALAIEH